MQHTIQQVNLTKHIPINIRVWSGHFELYSHPELSIKIDATGIENNDLIPEISFIQNEIRIANQSLTALLVRSDAVKIKVYVPDESVVKIRQVTGHITVSGSYKKLTIHNWLGGIYIQLDTLFIKDHSELKVISGDVHIDADDSSIIKSRSGYESYQYFHFYNNSSLKASAYLGEVKWKPTFNNRYGFA